MRWHYITCPHCDGEKTFAPNVEGAHKWYREDGFFIVYESSCECSLTEAELEVMEVECDKREMEPDEP